MAAPFDPLAEEPDAAAKQAALAAVLRGQRSWGLIGQLSGDPVLGQVGKSLLSEADSGEQRLESGKNRKLQLGLEAKKDKELQDYRAQELDLRGEALKQGRFSLVPTDQGYVPFNTRTGKVDAPSGLKPIPKSGGGAGGDGGNPDQLVPQALDDFASQLHYTGQMPAGLGMGKSAAATRIKIANRAAEMFGGTDLGGAKAGYGADSNSLKAQQRQADAMNAFEATALKNLDTFLSQASKVVDTGSPFFNMPGRKFAARVAGDPEMAAFTAARQTAVQEIGKVLSGSLGGTAISDSARNEAAELLGEDASLAQIKRAAEILKIDMANRKEAVAGQIRETRGRMSGKPASEGSGPATGPHGPTVKQNGHTYTWNPSTKQYE